MSAAQLPVDPATPPNAATPLVSVLVRSLDRPQLQQALDSLAAQTHPHIEVLVVAAQPGHRPLPERAGPHALRLLDTDVPRPRSRAANVALDAARGEYLLFLDDDDWLLPEHLARLLAELQRIPSSLAAYAGVALVDAEGRPSGQVFDLPFDMVRQLSGNLMPIHAVLFAASLRGRGCRFDESLDRYEDWDFWIQVARQTLPLHVSGVSAVYRIHASSGVHDQSVESAEAARRVQHKWLQQSSPAQLAALMHRVWSHDDLLLRLQQTELRVQQSEQHLQRAEHEARLRELRLTEVQAQLAQSNQSLIEQLTQNAAAAQLAQAELGRQLQLQDRLLQELTARGAALADSANRIEVLNRELAALRNSTSWRLTAPLRVLRDRWSGSR